MARLKLDATNLPSIQRAMEQFPELLDEQLGQALRTAMEIPKAKAQQLARRGSGEGKGKRLYQTIYTRVRRSRRRGWSATLGANAPHARMREYGGTIRAKRKLYLKFRINGQFVQVKQVTQKATPYMKPAMTQSRAAMVSELQRGLERVAATIRQVAR